jgi:nucleoside-diphosphate-sugar epimerase
MSEPQTIAITGAGGFVGRHVVDAFRNDQVRLLLLSRKEKLDFDLPANASLVKGDITDAATLTALVKGSDAVLHLAGELRDETKMAAINTDATRRLGELALLHGVPKFVHLSSVGVTGAGYSDRALTITEETPCDPQNTYERTKLAGEEALRATLPQQGCKLTILRPTNVYGDHHPREALLRLLQRLNAGKRVGYKGGATANYVYAGDLAAALRHAALHDMAFPVYQVGHSEPFGAFLDKAIAALDGKGRHGKIPGFVFGLARTFGYGGSARVRDALLVLAANPVFDDSRLLREFHYPFGNAEGLARTVKWYRQCGKL